MKVSTIVAIGVDRRRVGRDNGIVGSSLVSERIRPRPAIARGWRRVSYASSISVLPESQPHAEHHLGGAEDPHPVRLLDEPHPDLAGALRADHPKARMPLRSQELYEPIPERDYRESLYEPPLPHGVLPFRFRAVLRAR
jgi:hypothetical protein